MKEQKAERKNDAQAELPIEAKKIINFIFAQFQSPSFKEDAFKREVIYCVQDYLTIEEMLTTGKRIMLINNDLPSETAEGDKGEGDKDKQAQASEDTKPTTEKPQATEPQKPKEQ